MRRFIAGAICPECRAADRIVVEEDESGRRRRCVSCGYADLLPEGPATEPATRLSRRRRAEASAAVVRIVERPDDER